MATENKYIQELFKHLGKPPLFERGNASMWEDSYISKQLLNFHLDPNCGMASRKPEAIDKTVKWITENFIDKEDFILDIGCGPGLYTSRLVKLGFKNVYGMDFSKSSINYAKEEAEKEELNINYIFDSYLNMDFKSQFNLITIIFCDFAALTNTERDILLKKVYMALKPGGKFIFDFYTEHCVDIKSNNRIWEFNKDGFWAEGKYAAFSQTHFYPEADVSMSQHIVITEDNYIRDYRFFNHTYSEETISNLLQEHGFKNFEFGRNIVNDNAGFKDIEVLFAKAEKPFLL